MIPYFFLILINLVYANPTWKWSNAVKVVEKHEFYKNNEILIQPKNSWQTLFGIIYHDSNLKTFKDCIFYRVPGREAGILKLKTILAENECKEYLYRPGDKQWENLKALQYSIQENFLTISLTDSQFKIEKWDVPMFNVFEHPKPKSLMSSAEYRSPKIIYLSPYQGNLKVRLQSPVPLSDKQPCHDIGEDCQEKGASTCAQCSQGWYEIPNGCPQGPKFCGSIDCGLKHQPACRRGMRHQKTQTEFGCRINQSFAYCAKGLSIQCQGDLPYCF